MSFALGVKRYLERLSKYFSGVFQELSIKSDDSVSPADVFFVVSLDCKRAFVFIFYSER